jgi:uncharacterized protein
MSIRQLFNYTQPLVSAATILVVGAIVVACIGAYVVYDIKLSGDMVEVTGSAKETVAADTARWVIHLETKTGIADQQKGYARLEDATKKITDYLVQQGFTDTETPAIATYPDYTYPQGGAPVQTGHTVSRDIIVRSSDVEHIQTIANAIEPLSGTGYNVTTGALELTYGKLNEARVMLLTEAIKDAKERATAIAKDSGRSVGTLRTATGGVVQVLPQGGIDISDYGSYDTQSMKKDVMVTVRATFSLK